MITTVGYVAFCLSASSNGSRFNDAKQHLLDRIVDPQAAEGDAARLTVVEQATPAGIARNVMIVSSVADRQLPPAPLTTEKTGKQSVAMLRRPVMSAGRHIIADHLADLLRPFPTNIAFVCIRDQSQPFIARLAANSGSAKSVAESCRSLIGMAAGFTSEPAAMAAQEHPGQSPARKQAHLSLSALGGTTCRAAPSKHQNDALPTRHLPPEQMPPPEFPAVGPVINDDVVRDLSAKWPVP